MAERAREPAADLASADETTKAWSTNFEFALSQGLEPEEILKSLEQLKLVSGSMVEAAAETLKCSSQALLHTVTAREYRSRQRNLQATLMDMRKEGDTSSSPGNQKPF